MKNKTNVDPYVKWNNTVIRIENEVHGAKVIEFWKSVGVDTMGWIGNGVDFPYYGIFNGSFDNTVDSYDCRVLTLEEAIAIRDSAKDVYVWNRDPEPKTFPRDMYVWNNDSSKVIKKNVVFIAKDHCIKYNIMTYNNGVWASYQHAMEVEEYEKLHCKQPTKRSPTIEEVIKWFEENRIFKNKNEFIFRILGVAVKATFPIEINGNHYTIKEFCTKFTDQNGNELYITE